ncbi:hypothetical protein K439DRAFT_1662595 [Ramaria rubella]|nr:hypothetical protein K439DRAFT_1662595 [Ramaria rubella]
MPPNHCVHGPVTDIVWFCNKQGLQAICFSCANGTIHVYVRQMNHFQAAVAICAHRSAIESIDYDPIHRCLASAGGGEAKVWNVNAAWVIDLHATQHTSGLTCRTVKFTNEGQSLVAMYLENANLSLRGLYRSGNAAISPDGNHVLIDNLRNGMDAYAISSGKYWATFHAPVTTRKPKQVIFNDSGKLVIQGSDKGLVYISDFDTVAPVQPLVHISHLTQWKLCWDSL